MRLQQTSEAVSAKIRISQAVWQRVPKRRAGHREGPWTQCAEPASRNHQETPSSGSKTLPCWEVGHVKNNRCKIYPSVYRCVKYSMFLISYVVVIVVCPLFVFNIETKHEHLCDKNVQFTISKLVFKIFCDINGHALNW